MAITRSIDTRYSLLDGLPRIYREDDFLVRFVGGFDDVLAPVHATVDDLDAYLDMAVCPPNYLPWLASWLGLEVDERWPTSRRRRFVREAVEVYRWRGTAYGIELAVELYTGASATVTDSGGLAVEDLPGGEPPGSPELSLEVTVRTTDAAVTEEVVDRIVQHVKPVHVPHTIHIRRS